MDSEILDDEFENKVIKTKFVWKSRLVVALIWLVVIWRFIEFPYFDFELIWSVIGLSIATFYLVINSSIAIYAIFVLLGLGMFNVINHFTSVFYFTIGSLSINMNYLGLLILHAILNSDEWLEVLRPLLRTKSRKSVSKEKPISDNRFIKKFKDKTEAELNGIIEGSQYSKEAVESAKELMKRRNVNQ